VVGGNRGGEPVLLFVGNLTYAPNVDAARMLVQDVAPRVRARVQTTVRVLLVGPYGEAVAALAGPHVEVAGFVPDLAPWYDAASAVVAPIAQAAGTRIKLLDAFAYGTPVVASSAAAAGLDVRNGEHLLVSDGPAGTAGAVATLLADAGLARRLAANARRLVIDVYPVGTVVPLAGALFSEAARAHPGAPA
jgi:glycosyltransferase involved in cell wall biosynthesis